MKENRIRKNAVLCGGVLLLLLLCCLSGCGRETNTEVEQAEEQTIPEEVEILQDIPEKETMQPIVEKEMKSEGTEQTTEEVQPKPQKVATKIEEVPKSEPVTPEAEAPLRIESTPAEEVPKAVETTPAIEISPTVEENPTVEAPQKEEMQKPESSLKPPTEPEEEVPPKETALQEKPPEQLDMSQIGDVFVSAEEYDEKVSNSDVGTEE